MSTTSYGISTDGTGGMQIYGQEAALEGVVFVDTAGAALTPSNLLPFNASATTAFVIATAGTGVGNYVEWKGNVSISSSVACNALIYVTNGATGTPASAIGGQIAAFSRASIPSQSTGFAVRTTTAALSTGANSILFDVAGIAPVPGSTILPNTQLVLAVSAATVLTSLSWTNMRTAPSATAGDSPLSTLNTAWVKII